MDSLVFKEQVLPNYDEKMVALFRQSITFKANKYYIRLPWESEKIFCILSKYSADHESRRLEWKGLYRNDLEVFRQHAHDGITDAILVPLHQFKEYV